MKKKKDWPHEAEGRFCEKEKRTTTKLLLPSVQIDLLHLSTKQTLSHSITIITVQTRTNCSEKQLQTTVNWNHQHVLNVSGWYRNY